MSNASIWKVVISGALALICICIVQGYWLKNAFDLGENAFQEKVHICLRNVAESISELHQVQLPAYNVVNQVSQDYYIVNIRDAIDANNLEYFLQEEFAAVSLPVDFEYGIYDCDTDKMVYGNYVGADDAFLRNNDLPTYDEFTYYFGVRFPNRKGYILKNQWLPLLFTAILFLAVIFFSYATYVILRQKKLSDLQKDFINNMTHEFKTPITSIKISSEVMLDNEKVQEDGRLLQYAEIIHQQASRLNRQVERVLQIASLSREKAVLSKEPLELHELLLDITEQMKSRFEQENVHVELELNAHSSQVLADRLHLSNVIYGLLDNAIKYSKSNPSISIVTSSHPDGIELSIADKGIGIDKIHLKRLGQKFFRVPSGNIHNVRGFGLGLHYIRQIVRKHQWNMQIQSELGKGTEVTIKM